MEHPGPSKYQRTTISSLQIKEQQAESGAGWATDAARSHMHPWARLRSETCCSHSGP